KNYIDLPSIHNLQENDQVTKSVLSGWYVWFGLYLDPWEWSDQWDLRFRHWATGQPFNSTDSCVG
ncbi:hypothetical protein M9458_004829, partial [Cirrhinus mrigala]